MPTAEPVCPSPDAFAHLPPVADYAWQTLTDLFAWPVPPIAPVKPYIIAEAGVNHEGNLDLAKRLIAEAKQGGADAIKFQTYKAGTIACKNSPAYWDTTKEATTSQYQLFSKYDGFWQAEYQALKEECDAVGIEFLSTPFDMESVEFLAPLMPVFKVASADLTNRPFIEAMCKHGKPMILSTGASTLEEVAETLRWIAPFNVPVALLHCILNYPTPNACANLAMISDLKRQFPRHIIGYSDHTLPEDMTSLEMATLLGAVILEKHFTHDKTLPGNDHYHAMDWQDLKRFRKRWAVLDERLGQANKAPLPTETPAREHARRSLVAAHDIPQGYVLTEADLTWKRPAHGISPSQYYNVLGKTTTQAIADDTPLQWDWLTP